MLAMSPRSEVSRALLPVAIGCVFSSCSTPEPAPYSGEVCQPYYQAELSVDPNLDALNVPKTVAGKINSAQVGDTVIRRYLNARFPAGEALIEDGLVAPIPMRLALNVDWSIENNISDLLTPDQIEALTKAGSCRKKASINLDNEVLTAGEAFENKLQAANVWSNKLKATTTSSNTLVRADKIYDPFVYKIKNYKGAAMWLFRSSIPMLPREELYRFGNSKPYNYEAEGIWELENGQYMLAVKKYKINRERDDEITDVEYLLLPTPSIKGIGLFAEDHSTPWINNDYFFDQRLIYNGLSGSTVKFLYREFSGSSNRSQYEQDVTYDLNIGEVIGFKSARFRILSATNTGIEYEVLAPFSKDGIYSEQKTY